MLRKSQRAKTTKAGVKLLGSCCYCRTQSTKLCKDCNEPVCAYCSIIGPPERKCPDNYQCKQNKKKNERVV